MRSYYDGQLHSAKHKWRNRVMCKKKGKFKNTFFEKRKLQNFMSFLQQPEQALN
jgi:hypothetical protein